LTIMAKLALSLCLLALVGVAISAPALNNKVHPFLRKALQTKLRVNVLVSMKQGVDAPLSKVEKSGLSTKAERATAVYTNMRAHAAASQAAVLEMLESPRFFAINVRSFWITNQIYIQGADQYLIDAVAEMDDVSSIEEEEIVYLQEPAADAQNTILAEWGIEKIQAEQAWAWAPANNGNGAVIGIIDTGARHTHTLIRDGYRAGNHAWYNPYASQANPTDGHGHGTHVTGTTAGTGGIGVAPGAKWISCKGLRDDGSGTNAGLIACGEFMACPHGYQGPGTNPDCSLAPDVSSNSWGGAGGQNWYDAVIRAWHAAGVIPVFAAGNSGPSCTSGLSPGDSAADVIGVGATTNTDAIASFSSRGPTSSGARQLPQVSAPGNQVRSAGHTSDTAFATMSGTSMACPHVAGLVALLRAGSPNASYATIKNILQNNADRNLQFSGQVCAGQPDNVWPNYTFGYGRINALRSVNALLKMLNSTKA
jgi:subtilisin family serine protease